MQIRFLDLVESESPEFPFMPGQVINVSSLTPAMRAAVKDGRAELVRDEPELATVGVTERAVTRRGRTR